MNAISVESELVGTISWRYTNCTWPFCVYVSLTNYSGIYKIMIITFLEVWLLHLPPLTLFICWVVLHSLFRLFECCFTLQGCFSLLQSPSLLYHTWWHQDTCAVALAHLKLGVYDHPHRNPFWQSWIFHSILPLFFFQSWVWEHSSECSYGAFLSCMGTFDIIARF